MLRDEMRRDLKEAESDLRGPDGQPQWLVYGTLTLPCVPSGVTDTVVIDTDGNTIEIQQALLVRTDHFEAPGLEPQDADAVPDVDSFNTTPIPNVGEMVRFRWTDYRVVRRVFDSTQAYVRLDLADANSNR
jgi:hypothetical protein